MGNFIERLAEKFVQFNLNWSPLDDYEIVVAKAKEQLDSIINPMDKITFLNVVLNNSNELLLAHKEKCPDPINCQVEFQHDALNYFLRVEMEKYGIPFNEDTFTNEDWIEANQKLDKVISSIESLMKTVSDLANGQEVIFDTLIEEMEEMRKLGHFGKKKWHQLLRGKMVEMAASGVVGATLSPHIIKALEELPEAIFPSL